MKSVLVLFSIRFTQLWETMAELRPTKQKASKKDQYRTVCCRIFLALIDTLIFPYSAISPLNSFAAFFLQTLCNIIILLACIAGFYMFTIVHASKREDFQAGLDVVLLFICLIGPLLVDLFSVLSLSAGPEETKRGRWEMSLASSITDIVVSIVQVCYKKCFLYSIFFYFR